MTENGSGHLYDSFVFSGAGAQSAIFFGPLIYIATNNVTARNVCGVSGGAFAAVSLIMMKCYTEFSSKCIGHAILYNMLQSFRMTLNAQQICCTAINLYLNLGMENVHKLISPFWGLVLETLSLREKNITSETLTFSRFYGITNINLVIVATKLNSSQETQFSHILTPDVSVLSALEASMAIPFVFQPVCIDGQFYLDGGLVNNLPMSSFDNEGVSVIDNQICHQINITTLGFMIEDNSNSHYTEDQDDTFTAHSGCYSLYRILNLVLNIWRRNVLYHSSEYQAFSHRKIIKLKSSENNLVISDCDVLYHDILRGYNDTAKFFEWDNAKDESYHKQNNISQYTIIRDMIYGDEPTGNSTLAAMNELI